MERRLAAILAADLVGYSALMERDEAGTLARLQAAVDHVLTPAIADHGGRVFKTMGDGLLAEFPSVLAAAACAVKVQGTLAEQSDSPGTAPLRFRIGINLGDVIVEGGDLYGDGVNVAARVEALAPPGGVCITRPVRDQIRDRFDWFLEDWGQVTVKNLTRPVRVFRVVNDPDEARRLTARARARRWSRVRLALGGAAVAAILLLASPLSDPPADTDAEAVQQITGTVAVTRRANLRQGPGLDHAVVDVAAEGTELSVTGSVETERGRWLRVVRPGRSGEVFIFAGLVADVPNRPAGARLPPVSGGVARAPDPLPQTPPPPEADANAETGGESAADAGTAPPQAEPATQTVAAAGPTSPAGAVWLRIGLDLSDTVYADCPYRTAGARRVPVGAGGAWQRVRLAGPENFDLHVRARPAGGALRVDVWPYRSRWPEANAITVALDNGQPGAAGRAFSTRRAEPPWNQCGQFAVYVTVVAPPEDDAD